MTTINLTPELEHAIMTQAQIQATTPEKIILDVLWEKFQPKMETQSGGSSLDEWDQQIRAAAIQLRVSQTDTPESHR